MHIIKDEEMIAEDIFDGRNTEWFCNLQKEGNSPEYDYLPVKYGIPEKVPSLIKEDFEDCFYGFHYITVGGFIDWFEEFKPELHAGWATIHDWWLYRTKHVHPAEVYTDITSIPKNERDNYEFNEFTDHYDCSLWLYNYLHNNHTPMDAIIVYYFDH